MRVAMVLGASLGMLPWNYFYLDEFLNNECEVTVISWNREGIGNENIDGRIILKEYRESIDNSISKIKKIQPFYRFRRFAAKILRDEDFDLVVFSTLQIALLFYDMLLRKYKGKYIYDVRDPWFESKAFIHEMSDHIVKNADTVFISSEAFKKWLPEDEKIVVTHNVRFQDCEKYEYELSNTEIERKDVIRIVFWGITREVKTNIKFIDVIANDPRFQLEYYGVLLEESKAIFEYCKDKGIRNVAYKGTFPKDGRVQIARNTDLIHDIYMGEKENYDTRVFNKYYDGIVFEIPQITYCGGFTGECVEQYGVGVSISLSEGDADRIYKYYKSINRELFHQNCVAEQRRIQREMDNARERLDASIERFKNK